MSKNNFSLKEEALRNPGLLAVVAQLRRDLRDCKSVLDLGCGYNSPARFLNGRHLVGIDGYEPDLERARQRGTHDEYICGDVRRAAELVPGRRFDACIALDVIEHLTKEDGWQMLKAMEQIAVKKVIIFTPNGFVPQFSENGDLQQHLSGWETGEMRQVGYRVVGMNGPKSLRGEKASIKYRPRLFWITVSLLGQCIYSRRRPETAFSIYCSKELGVS